MSFLDDIKYPIHLPKPIFDGLNYERSVDGCKKAIDEALAGFVGAPSSPQTQQQMEATARSIVARYTEVAGDHYEVSVDSSDSSYINVRLTPKGPGHWQEIFCKSCVTIAKAYHHGIPVCPNCKSMDVLDAATANARTAPRD